MGSRNFLKPILCRCTMPKVLFFRYAQIMVHLCRAEILISLIFLAHGTTCPGYPTEAEYQSTCHMNTVSAIVSLLTGAMGLGAVHRYRWRTMLILWLVFCIMSAVGSLLAVITTGKRVFCRMAYISIRLKVVQKFFNKVILF